MRYEKRRDFPSISRSSSEHFFFKNLSFKVRCLGWNSYHIFSKNLARLVQKHKRNKKKNSNWFQTWNQLIHIFSNFFFSKFTILGRKMVYNIFGWFQIEIWLNNATLTFWDFFCSVSTKEQSDLIFKSDVDQGKLQPPNYPILAYRHGWYYILPK